MMPEKIPKRMWMHRFKNEHNAECYYFTSNPKEGDELWLPSTPTLERAGEMKDAMNQAYLRLPMLLGKCATAEDINRILNPIHDILFEIAKAEEAANVPV